MPEPLSNGMSGDQGQRQSDLTLRPYPFPKAPVVAGLTLSHMTHKWLHAVAFSKVSDMHSRSSHEMLDSSREELMTMKRLTCIFIGHTGHPMMAKSGVWKMLRQGPCRR